MPSADMQAKILKVRNKVRTIGYDSVNPHFKNKYTSLKAIVEFLRPLLNEEGLTQDINPTFREDGTPVIAGTIRSEGESYVFAEFPYSTNIKPQDLGSLLTYMSRYFISGFWGIVSEEDDDGNKAQKDSNRVKQATLTIMRGAKDKTSLSDDEYGSLLETYGAVTVDESLSETNAQIIIQKMRDIFAAKKAKENG